MNSVSEQSGATTLYRTPPFFSPMKWMLTHETLKPPRRGVSVNENGLRTGWGGRPSNFGPNMFSRGSGNPKFCEPSPIMDHQIHLFVCSDTGRHAVALNLPGASAAVLQCGFRSRSTRCAFAPQRGLSAQRRRARHPLW